jgi:hypothetical protein
VKLSPPNFYSIDLLVVPNWGLCVIVTAQVISQVSSHFIVHYHRRIVHGATNEEDGTPDLVMTHTVVIFDEENEIDRSQSMPDQIHNTAHTVERLWCNHGFRRQHRGDPEKFFARRPVGPLQLFFSSCLCVLVVAGCVLPSYSLKALGIVGVLVESGQAFVAADTDYSIFTTIELLFDQARLTGGATGYIGLGSLSVLLFLTVLIVPVTQSTRKRRYRLPVFLEILQAPPSVAMHRSLPLAVLVASLAPFPVSILYVVLFFFATSYTFRDD